MRQLLLATDQFLEVGARGLGGLARALDDRLHQRVADLGRHENVNQARGAFDADRLERLEGRDGQIKKIGVEKNMFTVCFVF